MNAQRRKQLSEISDKIELIKEEITFLQEEEQDALDNMPDSLQYSDKGERMQTAIDAMDSILQSLDDSMMYILEAIES